jgi:hypothetical protein
MHFTSKPLPSAREQAEQDQEMAGLELICSLKWPLPKLSRLSLSWYNLQHPTANTQTPNAQERMSETCRPARHTRVAKLGADAAAQADPRRRRVPRQQSNRLQLHRGLASGAHTAGIKQSCLQATTSLPTEHPTSNAQTPKHPTPNAREPTWKAAERPTPSQPKPPTQQWRPQAAQAVVATSDLKNSNTTALANNGCYTRKMRKDLRMVWTWRCQKSELVIGIGIERAIC